MAKTNIIWHGTPQDLARSIRDFLDTVSRSERDLVRRCQETLSWTLDHHACGTPKITILQKGRRHYPIAHS